MVTFDLKIIELIGLASMGNITKEKLKEYLDKFSKEEIIDYIVSEAVEDEEVDDYP